MLPLARVSRNPSAATGEGVKEPSAATGEGVKEPSAATGEGVKGLPLVRVSRDCHW